MSRPEFRKPGAGKRPARLSLMVRFHTDGDFRFDLPEGLIDTDSPLYKEAFPDVSVVTGDETYEFRVRAQGPADQCRYAARDALENLICAIRTFRSYLVGDLYAFLSKPLGGTLWDEEVEQVYYQDAMSGNYEGTILTLDLQYVDAHEAKPENKQRITAEALAAAAVMSATGRENAPKPGEIPAVVRLNDRCYAVTDAGYDAGSKRFIVYVSDDRLE